MGRQTVAEQAPVPLINNNLEALQKYRRACPGCSVEPKTRPWCSLALLRYDCEIPRELPFNLQKTRHSNMPYGVLKPCPSLTTEIPAPVNTRVDLGVLPD